MGQVKSAHDKTVQCQRDQAARNRADEARSAAYNATKIAPIDAPLIANEQRNEAARERFIAKLSTGQPAPAAQIEE